MTGLSIANLRYSFVYYRYKYQYLTIFGSKTVKKVSFIKFEFVLKEETGWECDLDGLIDQIDEKTVAIIINNPSNPCGSVFSKKHCLDIIQIAEKFKLPIIADEVYGNMAFPGNEYFYLAELTDNVPILSCNALSKRFMLPGWRFGWIAIHDPKNHIKSNCFLLDLNSFKKRSIFNCEKL